MKSFPITFIIKYSKNCPLYDEGEYLLLTEKTFSCPAGKESCLILVRDMTTLLFNFLQTGHFDRNEENKTVFNCSGCKGLIKFAAVEKDEGANSNSGNTTSVTTTEAVQLLQKTIAECAIFCTLSSTQVAALTYNFREVRLKDKVRLITKGEENQNIYVVQTGELVVEDQGLILATLGRGEICGEMSYLGADVAVSNVMAKREAVVLAIEGSVFGRLLGQNPGVQSYMAKLLATRLRKTNAARARDLATCMSGRIDEIVPAELLQIFHMHQKTGELLLELNHGRAVICFKSGKIVRANFNMLEQKEAVYGILAEKKGFYRFRTGLTIEDMQREEIADFMMLLMEGVKQADEAD